MKHSSIILVSPELGEQVQSEEFGKKFSEMRDKFSDSLSFNYFVSDTKSIKLDSIRNYYDKMIKNIVERDAVSDLHGRNSEGYVHTIYMVIIEPIFNSILVDYIGSGQDIYNISGNFDGRIDLRPTISPSDFKPIKIEADNLDRAGRVALAFSRFMETVAEKYGNNAAEAKEAKEAAFPAAEEQEEALRPLGGEDPQSMADLCGRIKALEERHNELYEMVKRLVSYTEKRG